MVSVVPSDGVEHAEDLDVGIGIDRGLRVLPLAGAGEGDHIEVSRSALNCTRPPTALRTCKPAPQSSSQAVGAGDRLDRPPATPRVTLAVSAIGSQPTSSLRDRSAEAAAVGAGGDAGGALLSTKVFA